MVEMLGGCCVCSDDRGWPENPLVYCDGQGCNVAVHQACYGIVTVPSGPWFCRKCELHERAQCTLCPSKEGAFKKTDQNSWAHVVCALYIPEIRFGNVTSMEPILISLIPAERFNKTCYICEENNRGSSKANFGACMQCNKAGCKSTFHVTCAQMMGLLCEEAGNMMDNVKYCGYCQHHYAKLKATRHVKIIPPYRPLPSSSSRPVSPVASSSEKFSHGHHNKSSGSSALDDGKSGSAHSQSAPGSTTQNPSNEGSKSHSNVSPDINSCKANNKNTKKGNSFHAASGKASNNILDNKSGGSASSGSPEKVDGKGKSNMKPGSTDAEQDVKVKCEDNLTVKLERYDEKATAKPGFGQKKDFSTLQLKEVVTAALDRPMTNTSGKFDHVSANLQSGLDSSSAIPSTHAGRHSHAQASKIAPPDIRPVVTLTPIPLKQNSAAKSKDYDREGEIRSKTPDSKLSFSQPPKLQNQQISPDISDVPGSKCSNPPELTAQEEIPVLDKATSSGGPPTKRARGMSRDDECERELRRTPTKGRGGRRGSLTGSNQSRRERECRNEGTNNTSAVAFVDDSSFDEVIEANSASSGTVENTARGGRKISARLQGTAVMTRSTKAETIKQEDPPAPTLTQLKQSSQTGGEAPPQPPPALAPHMFGNALNPASSMAETVQSLLTEEMEAVAAAGGAPDIAASQTDLIGISFPGPCKPTTIKNSPGNTSAIQGIQVPPHTLEQLLERQWDQGSQFLMEQAQHLDIAGLLSCLNQLKQDNKALEEHVQSLINRRDQLVTINSRLSVPLGNSSALGLSSLGGAAAANANSHHGGCGINQSTPSPGLHPPGQGAKTRMITNSTPSPRQSDSAIGQHNARERNSFMNPDLPAGGRSELVVTHSSSQGSGNRTHSSHPNQGSSHHRSAY